VNVYNIAIEMISVMCYLNERKIMHRDIKPDNIKYFKGKCTLIDFGFACELDDKLKLKESVGTPSYMSP
jgi:serine/threonine protein kinase